jgi:hypothetical protein
VVGDVRGLLDALERRVHPLANLVAVGLGTPSSSMMTFIGRTAENSSTKSPPPCSTSASRKRAAVARTNGSRSEIARGVNARLTSLRWRSWRGGSMKMIMGSIDAVSISSRLVPCAELKRIGCCDASRTSS